MNYEQYIPKFLLKPQQVAFPPLLPERWSDYPSAQKIISTDASFYSDPTIGPTAKSHQFRKGVAADWASNELKYNPHYFTRFPYGGDNSRFDQTGYLQEMQGSRDLYDLKEPMAQDFEDADYEINAPAHLNAGLINNLIIPYIAGQSLARWETPIKRAELAEIYKNKDPREGIAGVLDRLFDSKLNERRKLVRDRITNPRYLGDATDAVGFSALDRTIDPTDIQLEAIRRYRSAIDSKSRVDAEVPWQYSYE